MNNFSRKPYGWYQVAILANIAKLFKRGKIELRADSNILDNHGAQSHLTNNRLFGNTLIFLQEQFDTPKIEKLKKFHREFFNVSNSKTEAKEVAHVFKDALDAEISTLQTLQGNSAVFPFVSQLAEPISLLKKWQDKTYAVYLNEVNTFENDWMDAKEDFIDPIKSFVSGQQGNVYKELQRFYQENRANLYEITAEEAENLNSYLTSEKPYSGNALKEAKSLKESLATQVSSALASAKSDALSKIEEKAAKLTARPDFSNLSAAEQEQLKAYVTSIKGGIGSAQLIAIVRDKLNSYLGDGYNTQLTQLSQMLAAKQKDSGGDAKPQVEFITKANLPVSYDKSTIEDVQDLEDYINALRDSYSKALANNKKISL